MEDRHVVLGGVADGPQLLDEGRLVVGGPDVGALEHEPGAHDVHLAVLAVLNQNVFIIVPGNSEQYARARAFATVSLIQNTVLKFQEYKSNGFHWNHILLSML